MCPVFNLTKPRIILISGEGGKVTQEEWEGARYGSWNDGLQNLGSSQHAFWSLRTLGNGVLDLAGRAGHHLLFLEATEVLVVGQGDALALPVLQEGRGSEGQLPDREVAQPQVRESTAFPAARPRCPKHLPIPLFLSPAHLAMGQILEIFHVARVLQSGHMRKAPSWPRSLPCEQNVPILGGTILNQLI